MKRFLMFAASALVCSSISLNASAMDMYSGPVAEVPVTESAETLANAYVDKCYTYMYNYNNQSEAWRAHGLKYLQDGGTLKLVFKSYIEDNSAFMENLSKWYNVKLFQNCENPIELRFKTSDFAKAVGMAVADEEKKAAVVKSSDGGLFQPPLTDADEAAIQQFLATSPEFQKTANVPLIIDYSRGIGNANGSSTNRKPRPAAGLLRNGVWSRVRVWNLRMNYSWQAYINESMRRGMLQEIVNRQQQCKAKIAETWVKNFGYVDTVLRGSTPDGTTWISDRESISDTACMTKLLQNRGIPVSNDLGQSYVSPRAIVDGIPIY